ncbi:transcriptional regulatory protein ume6-like protein [Colletotrichum truncatum]|uniref:Transcriptional regulatory protein ume6-like protein n=1 Tax=Colletotrichum truncatum TaxID=5467 RepID=A0ACC3YHK2_COLTU|nr:transcriptional regulatory protein ume6-like protein [Colletotrichum truncatum]KAF6784135.1 transcriptional regulatory protein ume6-like protein [Colletotrichum truncatum]
MQRDLQQLHENGIGNCLLSSMHLLANMMQQLSFELMSTPSGNWPAHLNAATNLFEQILEHHGKTGSTRQMSTVLDKLSRATWPGADDALNTEQGAFRFFSSLLLVADIISSTVLDQPAKLLQYHCELRRSGSPQQPIIDLEEITGCQTWVLLAISDISILSQWKKDQMISGKLSKDELIYRATSLERILNNGLDEPRQGFYTKHSPQHTRPLESLLNQSVSPKGDSCAPSKDKLPMTRIWIYAARSYLLSVKLDNDTKPFELDTNVKLTIQAFGAVTSSPWLRWLAWPLCVTGIYASKEQRPAVRKIMDMMCDFKAFSAIQAAFNIIERTWQSQETDEEYSDLSRCFTILGYKTLLL